MANGLPGMIQAIHWACLSKGMEMEIEYGQPDYQDLSRISSQIARIYPGYLDLQP